MIVLLTYRELSNDVFHEGQKPFGMIYETSSEKNSTVQNNVSQLLLGDLPMLKENHTLQLTMLRKNTTLEIVVIKHLQII